MTQDLLFHNFELSLAFLQQRNAANQTIDTFDANRLLNTPVEDLVEYFFGQHKIHPLKLVEGDISADHTEIKIDVSQDGSRYFHDRSAPFYVDGTRITFFVPYEGNKDLFYARPSTFTYDPPRGVVTERDLQLIQERLDHDAEAAKSEFGRELAKVRQYLGWMDADVAAFNTDLRQQIRTRVEQRRQKLLADQGLAAALGVPLRRREGAPSTYAAPVARKVIKPLPVATSTPYKPEPALAIEEYDRILSIMSNMVLVMERSPNAFKLMKEEDLRQHFLVQLNGQYEGQATGETFNFQGKTDILIRAEGKNIFIAECKFWKGEKAFLETIDQLLGYTSWRDTKAAILVFSRNKGFGGVVETIPQVVKQHPNYKRELEAGSETSRRYVFGHRDDPNRELILTVMAFDVPGQSEAN